MRCFIAIELDGDSRAELGRLQADIRSRLDVRGRDIRWVEPELMHLTLNFLGEVPDDKVPAVCEIVDKVASGFQRFYADVGTVGSFGRPAKVLWTGISDENDVLADISGKLAEELAVLGFEPEKRAFKGHITLARVKNVMAGRKILDIIGDYRNFQAGGVEVDRICLIQSSLTSGGPVYTVMSTSRLK
jgi:RNA 2',3'-cyclic 3'-phosphodiesterase